MPALDTTSKRLENDRVELSVTLPAADVDKQVAAVYKEASKARIHGFRPGKAPRNVLDNVYGGKEYFLGKATDELIRETCGLAIDAEGFVPLDSPDFADPQPVAEGSDYTYTMTFSVNPLLELSSYDPLEIELPSTEAAEVEVENQVELMRSYYVDSEGNKPELTDEWVKDQLDYDSVEEFRNRIAESIGKQKEADLPGIKEHQILDELIKRLEGEPPAALVSQTEQDIYRDFFNSLQRSGLTFDSFLAQRGISAEDFRNDAHQQAVEGASQGLALDAVARHENMAISDDDLLEEFANSGAEDTQAVLDSWKANGRLSELREGLLRMKALNFLKENAKETVISAEEVAAKAAAKVAEAQAAAEKAAAEASEAAEATEAAEAAEQPSDAAASNEPGQGEPAAVEQNESKE